MEKKSGFQKCIIGVALQVLLIVAVGCTAIMIWMAQTGYINQTVSDIRQRNATAHRETIAARILNLYFADKIQELQDYCSEYKLHYRIYHISGGFRKGNTSYSELYYGTLEAQSPITFDKEYDGYYAFPGIEYYTVKLLSEKNINDVEIDDPAYHMYWEIMVTLVRYKIGICALIIISSLLVVMLAMKQAHWSQTEQRKHFLPTDVALAGLLVLTAILFMVSKNRVREVYLSLVQGTLIAWAVGNLLLLLNCRLREKDWSRNLLVCHLSQALAKKVRESKRRINFQMTFWIYVTGAILISVLEIGLIIKYPTSQVLFITVLILEKLLVLLVIINHFRKYCVLQEYAAQIAAGNLDGKVDVDSMPLFLQKMGEHLNAIDGSVSLAVSEKMKSEHFKTELITNVSHDLKTPLTSIINFSDLIKSEETDNEKVKEYADHLFKQSTKLKKLVEDLIEASKASTGNIQAHMEPCDARVILGQCRGEFESRLAECDIELVVKNCAEQLHIMADPAMLARVFDNLLSNICKYTLPGTRVYITTEKNDGKARITFKNTSKNRLDDVSAEELMERFVRGDLSRHSEGHGLGLSIVKSLMDLQQGKVELSVDGDLFKAMLEFALIEELGTE